MPCGIQQGGRCRRRVGFLAFAADAEAATLALGSCDVLVSAFELSAFELS